MLPETRSVWLALLAGKTEPWAYLILAAPSGDGSHSSLGYPVVSESDGSPRQGVPVLLLFARRAASAAKFWIEPAVELHANYGLKVRRLAEAQKLVEEHVNEIRNAWATHFRR